MGMTQRTDWSLARKGFPVVAAMLLLVAALVLLLPGKAWAAGNTDWYVGHEADDSYVVHSVADLKGLAALVNDGVTDFAGKTITLEGSLPGVTPTLNLSGEWTPIGTESHPFNGTFDGGGSNIIGLSITTGSDGLGLFGYAGPQSTVGNLTIAGKIDLTVSTEFVKNVGAVVGCTQGSIEKCTSSVKVSIVSTTPCTESNLIAVSCVGGIAGRVYGDVSGCTTRSTASVSVRSDSAAPTEKVSWVNMFVGGIVGNHGAAWDDFEAAASPSAITDCTNNAKVVCRATAKGGKDRFGAETYAHSRFVAGIAGYAFGNILDCMNAGVIDTVEYGDDGAVLSGYGASASGGIVGGWRIDDETSAAGGVTGDAGTRYEKAHGVEPWITLSNCSNQGDVVGLAQVAGVAGESGTYTLITQCFNVAAIEGSRWNKPTPAGIAGRTYGNISYCYNQGDITSTSGGGYYVAGIVGMLHSPGRDSRGNTIVPEVYSCYNTGYLMTSSASYRSGSIVGELDDGFIHNCFSLENRSQTGSVSGLKDYRGTIASTVIEVGEDDAATRDAIALLNGCADKDGWQVYFALPSTDAAYGSEGVYPILVNEPHAMATDLSSLSVGSVETTAPAAYSSSQNPVPSVSVTLADGTTLVQNADYRVVPQQNTAGVSVGSTEYQASIEGIGIYQGVLGRTVSYRIAEGDISGCTVVADSKYYNFEAQKPSRVVLYDDAGNVVPEDQYTWNVDSTLFGRQNEAGTFTYYVDAQDANAATGYPIIVSATSGSNYAGTMTADVFKIKQVSFVKSNSSDNPNQDTFEVGKVIWGDQSWDFADVCNYVVVGGGKGDAELKGVMKVKYTGSAIKPTVEYVRYMGRDLKEVKDGDPWYENTKAYGYRLLYGNPNPENSGAVDSLDSVTNVTGTDYAVFTLRASYYSNYDNYLTVWFEITPASLSDDCQMTGFKDTVVGTTEQTRVSFSYNGMTLREGTDYIVAYQDLGNGKRSVTYSGIGNYNGTVTRTYQVEEPTASFSDVPEGKWYHDSVYEAVALGLFEGYDDGTFRPRETLTRAQAAAVLWNYFEPAASKAYDKSVAYNTTGMSDVKDKAWYTGAANWAVANGVISGVQNPDGTRSFDPSGTITRQQLCAIIGNACVALAGVPASDVEKAPTAKLDSMPDAANVSGWARPSVAWALNSGVISGSEDKSTGLTYVNPKDSVTRAEMATICVNAINAGLLG